MQLVKNPQPRHMATLRKSDGGLLPMLELFAGNSNGHVLHQVVPGAISLGTWQTGERAVMEGRKERRLVSDLQVGYCFEEDMSASSRPFLQEGE